MQVKFETKGFKELDDALGKLPNNIQKRVLQNAANAGMRVIRKSIIAQAPQNAGVQSPASERYGTLKENISKARKARVREKQRKSSYVSSGDAFWGYFLEKGTRYIPATRWFSRAVESAKDAALEKVRKSLGKGIDREFKKLAKK